MLLQVAPMAGHKRTELALKQFGGRGFGYFEKFDHILPATGLEEGQGVIDALKKVCQSKVREQETRAFLLRAKTSSSSCLRQAQTKQKSGT